MDDVAGHEKQSYCTQHEEGVVFANLTDNNGETCASFKMVDVEAAEVKDGTVVTDGKENGIEEVDNNTNDSEDVDEKGNGREEVSDNGICTVVNSSVNHAFEDIALEATEETSMEKREKSFSGKERRDVDEMIIIVGEYGMYQKIVNLMLCLMSIPTCFHLTIMYFLGIQPSWKCVDNSTSCTWNGTFESTDNRRCNIPRADWTYTVSKDYSVQTQFDIVCEQEYLISLSTTLFFIFWIFGAIIMGWVADNYGRKFALFISITVVLGITFISVWMPNFYLFIACRSIVGFFGPGTFPQMFILISEIVGEKQRPFAGISIFLCSAIGAIFLCIKAYFIRHWTYLCIACSVPYMLMLPFYFYIPESIRFLRVKGRMEEANATLRRIAYWNKKTIPSNITLSAPDPSVFAHHANPIDLFRTKNLALKTLVQAYAWCACGATYVGLYLAGADLDGDLYRDYILMAVGEMVGILIIMDLVERLGRKLSVMMTMVMGATVCVALGFVPKYGHFRIMRLVFGMAGKATLAMSFDALHTWSVELYPAKYRGEGMGIMQVATRIGTASCPWIAKEMKRLHENAPFVTMGVLSLIAFVVMFYLPETKGVKTCDVDSELENKLRTGENGINNTTVSLSELSSDRSIA